MRTDIDNRILQCIEHLINIDKAYRSERAFLQDMGFISTKITEARKGKSNFRAIDISNFLAKFPQYNGHWILTGQGEMFISEPAPKDSELSEFLKKQNTEMMETIQELRYELGNKDRQLMELKKDRAQHLMAAENADAVPYGLVK